MIVRKATAADAGEMADLLNEIIAIGGTTAHQTPKTETEVRHEYTEGPDVLSSVVAEADGSIVGWQSTEIWKGEAHIGTFVRPGIQAKGVGVAMFALTCDIVRITGHRAIIATIRSDNRPGLAYYARIGFVDFAADPDFALNDGTVVGRVHRRFEVV